MKKLSFIIIFIIFAMRHALAQENYVSVQYSAGIPFADLNDYIGETSYRGMAVDYHALLTQNVGLGFDVGWNVFYEEKGMTTITEGTESLTGYEYHYSNNLPVLASGAYYFMPESTFNPFASLGVGAVYSKRDTDLGSIRFTEDAWHFALKPEVGLIYQFSDRIGAKLSANYYQMFENDDFGSQSYLSFNLGLVFKKM